VVGAGYCTDRAGLTALPPHQAASTQHGFTLVKGPPGTGKVSATTRTARSEA
jgi:hypothetical protein